MNFWHPESLDWRVSFRFDRFNLNNSFIHSFDVHYLMRHAMSQLKGTQPKVAPKVNDNISKFALNDCNHVDFDSDENVISALFGCCRIATRNVQ